MVDPSRLLALLERVAEETTSLRRLAARDDADFAAEPDLLAAVKYRFVVAIEASIDACRHVTAARGLRAPTDFADSFAVLGEAGLLGGGLVPRLQAMARFRNLLVHGYARVDDGLVLAALRTELGDLDALRAALAITATR